MQVQQSHVGEQTLRKYQDICLEAEERATTAERRAALTDARCNKETHTHACMHTWVLVGVQGRRRQMQGGCMTAMTAPMHGYSRAQGSAGGCVVEDFRAHVYSCRHTG